MLSLATVNVCAWVNTTQLTLALVELLHKRGSSNVALYAELNLGDSRDGLFKLDFEGSPESSHPFPDSILLKINHRVGQKLYDRAVQLRYQVKHAIVRQDVSVKHNSWQVEPYLVDHVR